MAQRFAHSSIPRRDIGSLELTEEYIRQRAYQRFEQRGWQHGHDLEDWIQAEAEIMGKTRASASGDGRVPRDLAQAA